VTEPGYSRKTILIANTLSTTRNSTESTLLRLPGELRNRTLGYVVGGHIVVLDDGLRPRPTGVLIPFRLTVYSQTNFQDSTGMKRVSQSLTVTLVCRQLYFESAPLQFKITSFHFRTAQAFKLFAEVLTSRQRSAIKAISIGDKFLSQTLAFSFYREFPQIHPRLSLPGLSEVYLAPDAMRNLRSCATTHDKLGRAIRILHLDGDEGKGVWIGGFNVFDETAVLEDAPGFLITSETG